MGHKFACVRIDVAIKIARIAFPVQALLIGINDVILSMEVAMNQAVILQALRTPIGKFMGALKPFTAVDLGALVVKALLAKTSVPA